MLNGITTSGNYAARGLIKQLLCKPQLLFPSSRALVISIGKLTNVLTSPLSSRSLHFVPDCLKACRTLFRNSLSHTGCSETSPFFFFSFRGAGLVSLINAACRTSSFLKSNWFLLNSKDRFSKAQNAF